MEPFRVHRGRVAPLLRRDIDTDQIIPKQFLKRIEKTGFGQFLFNDWRTMADGSSDPAFVLNRPQYAGASILVSGPNFGCGSSREHAAWALAEAGFRAVVAPSFADIFRANAITNGLLPVVLPGPLVEMLAQRAQDIAGYELEINLENCRVADDHGLDERFTIDAGPRQRLLDGWDDVGLILKYEPYIARYEARNAPLRD